MLEKIIAAACVYFDITEEELLASSTVTDKVYRRSLCFYLIKQDVLISNERIAQRFGMSAGSTVSRQADKIEAHKKIYAQVKHDLAAILRIVDTL